MSRRSGAGLGRGAGLGARASLAARTLAQLTLALTLAPLAALPGCGGATSTPSQVVLRYAATAGAPTRYQVVAQLVPGDVPGRTISGLATLRAEAPAADGAQRIELAFSEIHVASEAGRPIAAGRDTRVGLVRDRQHALRGELDFGPEVAGADELARALALEALTFPEGPVQVGVPFALPPLERPVIGDRAVVFAREARLLSVEDGVAVLEVRGTGVQPPPAVEGATLSAEGELTERVRVRVVDGQLVERSASLEVRLTARLADGSEIGSRTHRVRSFVRRLVGGSPAPEIHDWRPDRLDPACEARLSALGRRFEHAPREVDFAPLARLAEPLLAAADGRDVDEAGALILGTDEASVRASLEAADLSRASVLYVAAPASVSDAELSGWLADQPSYLERRRLVERPVDPPAPRPSARAAASVARLRTADRETFVAALAPHLALCRTASQALTEVGPTPALRSRMTDALQRCGCDFADLGELEHLLDARLGGPRLGWLPM